MKQAMTMVIGYDGSDCAEAALDDLQLAGLPKSGEAFVVSVTELAFPFAPPPSYEIVELTRGVHLPTDIPRVQATESSALQVAQALAERAATRLSTNFPGWAIKAEAAVGSPAWELVRKADELKPDLIIVGSHGRSTFSRLVLGSVSQRVLNEARCSVRVARGRVEEPDTPVRIVVGVDGSTACEAAVREIAARVWPPKTEVKILAVNDPLSPTLIGQLIPPLARTVQESNEADREWLVRIMSKYEDLLQPAEVITSTEIRDGDPKHALVAAA